MESIYALFEKPREAVSFDAIRIRIASPEKVRSWSYGEVKKPETINYRSFKPEKDGLFCAKIFGPTKDWECNCGKYKRMKHRGIVCDKCGVEVIQSKVRRERMGHIELAAPVAHIWFLKGVPSRIGVLLDMSLKQLEKILYFEAYVVIDPMETPQGIREVLAKYVIDGRESRSQSELPDHYKILGLEKNATKKEINAQYKKVQAARVLSNPENRKEFDTIFGYFKTLGVGKNATGQDIKKQYTKLAKKYHPDATRAGDDREMKKINDAYGALSDSRKKNNAEKKKDYTRIFGFYEILGVAKDATHEAITGKIKEALRGSMEEIEKAYKALSGLEKKKTSQLREFLPQTTFISEEQYRSLVNTSALLGTPKSLITEEQLRAWPALMDLLVSNKNLIEDEPLRDWIQRYSPQAFCVGIGAESIRKLLQRENIEDLWSARHDKVKATISVALNKKLTKRLKVIEAFYKSGNNPEWMIMDVIPVLPPELRPLVPLNGGRFATSDLNDLYRRVINRNNRLKRLMELKAPGVIIRNEKRMLQEAVDALFDNGRRGRTIRGANKRPLKSLSDMLKGKQGRFRQNLLGKRVDYSGRSVIVVGPELKLNQCGLPKKMALELFKPFIFHKLEERGAATTIKSAKRLVEKERPEVWDVLDEVIREHPVILNRAPTLHRLGMQAFDPVLIEGKAIRLHPLVCAAFNADFDGDQMAVHVPLSVEAQIEARVLMMSINNVLSPANGRPLSIPSQDMVLGCYWLTQERPGAMGEGKILYSPEEVRIAYDAGALDEQAKIKVRIDGALVETTVGRVLFGEILPPSLDFSHANRVMTKKEMTRLIDAVYREAGLHHTVTMLDKLKSLGFYYATKAGVSICIDNMHIPTKKETLLSHAQKDVDEVARQHSEGLITDGERYNKVIDIWARVSEQVATDMMKEIKAGGGQGPQDTLNPIFMMADSGARGSSQQIRQLGGMRGLMAKPSGEIIETPITANFREGLTVLQYFISTHGARKGLADTALKTANSGYLTRRLVDIAQDVIVSEDDCGTADGINVSALVEGGEVIQPIEERILGRISADDILDPVTKHVVVPANEELDETRVKAVVDAGVDRVRIRSTLTCQARWGVCVKCYGRDLARGKLVELGEPVGVIAAQSIGEPGTQLTMRTFHIGGTASKVVEQSVVESRYGGVLKYLSFDAKKNVDVHNGRMAVKNKQDEWVVMNRNAKIAVCDDSGREREKYAVVYGAKIKVKDGKEVTIGQKLVEWDPYSEPILTKVGGRIAYGDLLPGVTMKEVVDEITGLSHKVVIEPERQRVSAKDGGKAAKTEADTPLRPRISVKDDGKTADSYPLPVGAYIEVEKGDMVHPGDVLAKRPRETTKTKDITGGLPRVAELFEARKPKEKAVISEIDGEVFFPPKQLGLGKLEKGTRQIIVDNKMGDMQATGFTMQEEEEQLKKFPTATREDLIHVQRMKIDDRKEYFIARGKHINVHEGDWVLAGDSLMEGSRDPHDILNVKGPRELQGFLVNEVQEVYRLQGVSINDKHIEIIARQMLKKIRIEDPGDTNFLPGAHVGKFEFKDEDDRVQAEGGKRAVGKPLLLGITKASLSTDSFISGASFQETTRVLTEAAINGRVDNLLGLKENVIVGRLIPAGTGFSRYRETFVPPAAEAFIESEPDEGVGGVAGKELQTQSTS